MSKSHDLVVRNGTLVDGTGSAPIDGDIAIDNGKISAIGQVHGSGTEEIDADLERVVGEITSGAMGYRTNKFVALSVIRTDCGEPGTALEVEVFGERRAAVVTGDEALWDPQNERLRA